MTGNVKILRSAAPFCSPLARSVDSQYQRAGDGECVFAAECSGFTAPVDVHCCSEFFAQSFRLLVLECSQASFPVCQRGLSIVLRFSGSSQRRARNIAFNSDTPFTQYTK